MNSDTNNTIAAQIIANTGLTKMPPTKGNCSNPARCGIYNSQIINANRKAAATYTKFSSQYCDSNCQIPAPCIRLSATSFCRATYPANPRLIKFPIATIRITIPNSDKTITRVRLPSLVLSFIWRAVIGIREYLTRLYFVFNLCLSVFICG